MEEEMLKYSLIFFMAATLFYACASFEPKEISIQNIKAMAEKKIVQTQYEKPNFIAGTATTGAFAMFGAVAAVSQGNSLIEKNNVSDPAIKIGDELCKFLCDKYNLKMLDNTGKKLSSNEIDYLINEYRGANYILDIKTTGWGFGYFPGDWNNYYVNYSSVLRVIDTESKEVIAQDVCSRMPKHEDTNKAPTYDYLTDNNAQGLKNELNNAADYCIKHYKDSIFKNIQ